MAFMDFLKKLGLVKSDETASTEPMISETPSVAEETSQGVESSTPMTPSVEAPSMPETSAPMSSAPEATMNEEPEAPMA